MYGAAQLLKGTVESAMIGGVEETTEMVFSVLDRIGSLAQAEGDVDEASRPFDRRRNGMILGEGSAMLIAQQKGKKTYGYLAGFGIARDVTATVSDWGTDPNAIVTAMRAAIDDAEIEISDVDAIYASANSMRRADKLESLAIQRLFGDRVPPVVATKGTFGEYAAAGALQLVAALLAIDEQSLHPSCGFEQPDDEMTIDVTRESRPTQLRNVLVNSISAGGGILCAVVSR
jgi:3-oxoacyl-[acyl-carrier-protein] synthase II